MTQRGLLHTTTVVLLLLLAAVTVSAQTELPAAEITDDEGGPVLLTGSFPISNGNVISSTYQPILVLESQTGFIDRNLEYVIPVESQVMGALTSPYTVGTITYELRLPAEPGGEFRDVDNDGQSDTGVQVYAVAVWDNSYMGEAGVFIDEYDGRGWSTAYTSVEASINPATLYEYIGGTIVIYAPDDQQGFPSGFGTDGLLFTEDDPAVAVPQGYTVVSMDSDPFTFSRPREAEINLIEPEGFAPDDYSDLSYPEAFNALIDKAINEYVFTELKGIDWEALRAEFLPRFEAAEADNDPDAYALALWEFSLAIPDGHIAVSGTDVISTTFRERTSGGVGLALIELDDGRVVVNFVVEGSPADQAGIERFAELTEVNGLPIGEARAQITPLVTLSTEEMVRYQQLRYLLRAPLGEAFTLTYLNPGATTAETVTLETVADPESFTYSSINRDRPRLPAPVEFEFYDNGVGYISVNSFAGNERLIVETWEYFLRVANTGSPGIIIDLRYNGGGFSSIGQRLAGYFFREEIPLYFDERYNPEIDDFFYDDRFPDEIRPALNEDLIYDGPVAVLVSPACASACEFFAYNFAQQDRVTFIGQYATYGISGGWFPTFMPEGLSFALPTSRPIDLAGEIIIEGVGIAPEVDIPITEETLQYEGDLILDSARAYIVGDPLPYQSVEVEVVDAGAIPIGDSVSGTLEPGLRYRYTLTTTAEGALDFIIDSDADTVIRIFLAGEDEPRIQTLAQSLIGIGVEAGLDIIIEIGGAGDIATGDFTFTVRESTGLPPSEAVDVTTTDMDIVALGGSVEGELAAGERQRWRLILEDDLTVTIALTGEDGTLDTYLRVYNDAGDLVAENDDIVPGQDISSLITGLDLPKGTYVIEVGTFQDSSAGRYTLTVEETVGSV
jgi:C-terminal processing protease CtpA/Prc